MSNNVDMIDKRNVISDCEDKYTCKIRRGDHNYRQIYEYDKKMKREIANSNERRRMQSINTGFETLKELLPMSIDGEKLSKASILQLTAKYIQTLLSRLSTLEKEIACYKKTTSSNEKLPANKFPLVHSQEQTRKRRLSSCTADTVTLEVSQTSEAYIEYDVSGNLDSLSLPGSETCLLACDHSDKTPGSLEHLVAAIEQVEGERFYVSVSSGDKQQKSISGNKYQDGSIGDRVSNKPPSLDQSPIQSSNLLNKISFHHSMVNSAVMKPTISPYTEKIIRAVSKHPHMFDPELPTSLFNTDTTSVQYPYRNTTSDNSNFESRNHLHLIKSFHDDTIRKNKTL